VPAHSGSAAASAHGGPAARDARATGLAGAGSAPGRPLPEPTDLASRAADVAARVAMLVSAEDADRPSSPGEAPTKLSAYLNPDGDGPRAEDTALREPRTSADSLSRAEAVRLTAARMVGNAARLRGTAPQRHADGEIGATTRGGHRT
jgi:hypothetical protein